MIELHYCPTPNCWKVAILLEETGLRYAVKRYDLFKGDHLVPAFRRINPNNKLPAIVDQDPADGGPEISVFESGAILFYLAEKTGQFLSRDARPRTATMKWLAWQIAGLGPMMGQAGHFVRYVREPHPYSAQRYLNESRRLLHVLEYRLRESEYLSDEYSIADMAVWPLDPFPGAAGDRRGGVSACESLVRRGRPTARGAACIHLNRDRARSRLFARETPVDRRGMVKHLR
jgi:GST-like protein